MCCGIITHDADGAKSDDTEFLAADFISGNCASSAFQLLCKIRRIFWRSNHSIPPTMSREVEACRRLPALFTPVCIGARRKKTTIPVRTFIKRNIIDACTGSGNRFEIFGKFHLLH